MGKRGAGDAKASSPAPSAKKAPRKKTQKENSILDGTDGYDTDSRPDDVRTPGSGALVPLDAAPPLDRGQLSSMLSSLKYTADPFKNKSGQGVDAAAKALMTYSELEPQQKHKFLEVFQSRGKKDLTWVASFDKTISNIDSDQIKVQKGMFNRHQVLRMNGFHFSKLQHVKANEK